MVKHGRNPKAPYSKFDRLARRKEVARLHFDLGYPGSEIADLMKKNPKTIYNDIDQIYEKLAKDLDKLDLDNWICKQLIRLEKQRGQLVQLLDKQDQFEKIVTTQRLILEIDNRITNIVLRTKAVIEDTSKDMIKMFNHAVDEYNKAEKKKSKYSDRIANNYNQGFKDSKFKMIFE